MFDWQMFCTKLVILPNLFNVNKKETISERWEAVWCLFYLIEQAISFSFFRLYIFFLIDSIMLLHNELSKLFHQICYYTFLVLRNRKSNLLTK